MLTPTKFSQLVTLLEYTPPAAPNNSYQNAPAPNTGVPPTTFRSKVNAAGQAVGRSIGNTIRGGIAQTYKDPRAVRKKGALGFIEDTIGSIKKNYSDIRNEQLRHYYDKLDFPAGWPKKGSKFIITDTKNLIWIGMVQSVANINNQLVYTVGTAASQQNSLQIQAQSLGQNKQYTRKYVIELNPKTRAAMSVVAVWVSDSGKIPNSGKTVTPSAKNQQLRGWVKNKKESDPNYLITYDTQTQSFKLDRRKTYLVYAMFDQGTSLTLPIGSKLKGKDIATNKDVTGVTTGALEYRSSNGTNIPVYPMEATF